MGRRGVVAGFVKKFDYCKRVSTLKEGVIDPIHFFERIRHELYLPLACSWNLGVYVCSRSDPLPSPFIRMTRPHPWL